MYKKTYKRSSKNAMENSTEKTKAPIGESELEVTGVSRSGRVRKKSSKLLDYESGAEEIERPRRRVDNAASASQKQLQQQQQHATYKKVQTERKIDEQDYFDQQDLANENIGNDNNSHSLADSDTEVNIFPPTEGYDDSSVDTSDTDLDEEELDDKSSVDETMATSANGQTEISNTPRSAVSNLSNDASSATGSASHVNQKSLYMLETFAKKRKTNPGRTSKAGRKDKGKARFSAYMLWAREVRPDLMKANPTLVFSQLSTKLSDLWATVPYTDKYMWKQKAKRMAMLARNSNNKEAGLQKSAQIKTSLRQKYINKRLVTPVSTKDCTHETNVQVSLTEISNEDEVGTTTAASSFSTSTVVTDHKNTNFECTQPLKNISSQPLDVAAHLKLLGESLSIIGQRLKEHEGQIAVSGSLSVLLDTLLCSLGPLLCLTQQVEEMNGCSKETLSSILDNIAYIMPGL